LYILNKLGLTLELLDDLSYKSEMNISFKRSLRRFDMAELIEELKRAIIWYNQ